MSGLLSLTTFVPLVGVAAILLLRALAKPGDPRLAEAVRWIALAATLAVLALAAIIVAKFDSSRAGFQMIEDHPWFAGLHY
ncbi:MAG: NADH-quinone oxidoreductase subunit M, partial [Candidatus Dormibacteria bacterium]